MLPPLPRAFVEGRDLDLLQPLPFATPGEEPALPNPDVDRRELAAALATANAAYGHPAAGALARRLADPATRVIVTGQQPGLLGGPLYTLSKAVAASLWAQRLEAAGQPAVAVFWVSTEDHDYREVSRVGMAGRGGPRMLELGDDPSPLLPVGMRTLGPGLEAVLRELAEANPGDRYADWIARVSAWYRPDVRFGEAFCRLMTGLLGERCPLLLDSMLPETKAAQRPWLRRIVERREEIEEVFAERNERIVERGYDLQIKPLPGASPLFYIHGGERRRVEWAGGDRLTLRGEVESEHEISWLLAAVEENPAVVSPGALARVAVQDAILGTSLLVLGPGEVSYLPQVAPLYDLLGIETPAASLRPQALVLAHHQLDKLAALDLTLADFTAPDLDLDRALAHGRETDLVGPVGARMSESLSELRRSALEIDPNLQAPWDRTRRQVEKALEAFTAKVASAVARQNDVKRSRAQDLRDTCRPQGVPQERFIATGHFPGKYGERLVEAYFEQLDLDPRILHLISP
jgi:bacillithiol biosynthesis cysteine-adding enzyme BshC